MTSPDAEDQAVPPPQPPVPFAAEKWFLSRGLPAVLRPGALVRRVWPRSAPALVGFAVMMLCSMIVVTVSGTHAIDIDGTPTRKEWFLLAVVVLVLPLAALAGWLVSRSSNARTRIAASSLALAVAVLGGLFGGPSPYVVSNLLLVALVIIIVLILTATGVGSILGWAVHVTLSNLALTGSLFVRALPVMLLTVLVFFNSNVWLMAAVISRARLWVALWFLFLIAAAFLVSNTLELVRPMLRADAKKPEDAQQLSGTPFENMPDRPRRVPLSRPERSNVVFVVALTRIVQVLAVAVVTGGLFFVLGLILLSPRLLAEWTRNYDHDGEILGMTLPVSGSLIQVSMFLAAMTFMYISARSVGDADQKARFLDPLIDDLRLTLVARDRYRTYTAAR